MPDPVLVTGSTGRIGRSVVDHLLAAGAPVRALAREPETAALPAAVEVVRGDFTDPGSLDDALRGAGAVFLLWTLPFAAAPPVIDRLARHARHLVFLSSPHRTPHPFFQQPNPMAELHTAVEQLLENTGVPTTVLRPGMLASNALHWWAPAVRAGEPIRWPYAKAETAPIDDRDIAAVAARLLADPDPAGGDYVLTGPEPLSQLAQLRLISAAIGRDISFEELSPDDFRRETAQTWPRPVVDMLLASWGATMGHPAYVTSTVAEILGSPARTFREWAADHASAFR